MGKTTLILLGLFIIVVTLLRHLRLSLRRLKKSGDYLDKYHLKQPEKDREFGNDPKWSIGDDK